MNAKNIMQLFNADKIAQEVERIAPEVVCEYYAWNIARHDQVAKHLERLAKEVERLGYVLCVISSGDVRAVFKAFDDKVINKRLWNAVGKVCEKAAPVGSPWKRGDGEIVQPCARLTFSAFSHYFGVVHVPRFDSFSLYGRFSDYSETTKGDEYQPIMGERLDAGRAVAVLEYHAERIRATLENIAKDAERLPAVIAKYLTGAQMIAEACEGIDWNTRDAFGLGSRLTLPSVIH